MNVRNEVPQQPEAVIAHIEEEAIMRNQVDLPDADVAEANKENIEPSF